MTILALILGAFFNRLRGGMFASLKYAKHIYDMAFAAFFTVGASVYGLSVFQLATLFCTLFLCSWIGRSFGWGAYIGNMIRRKDNGEQENILIDWVRRKYQPVLTNTIALSLRGFLWTLPIAIGFCLNGVSLFYAFLVSIVGLLMGVVYYITIEVAEKFTYRSEGWKYGEYVWGAVLWCGIYVILH
jgi:hypothetical protein